MLPSPHVRRFVLATAGVTPGDGGGLEFRERGSPDWAAAIATAHAEGALPHLVSLVDADQIPGFPDPMRAQLAMLAKLHAFRAGILEDMARKLADDLNRHGVPFLFLKGAALAGTVYSRFSDRPMGDLDLLVLEEQAADARRLALARGWTESLRVPGDAFYEGHQHLRPLKDRTGLGIGLDIHVHILPSHAPFALTSAEIWASSIPASELAQTGNGVPPWTPLPARVPALELLLLHVCVHFAWSHTFMVGAWKAFRDVDQVLRHPALDVDRFLSLAREAKALGPVRWTLWMARTLGGVTVAQDVAERLPGVQSGWRSRVMGRHLTALATSSVPESLPLKLQQALWELTLQPDAEGHRGARPWDRNPAFLEAEADGQASEAAVRRNPSRRRLARAATAARYLASIVVRP